ncbi:tetratricopeptide repeat protein [Alphaproteobacteria bacterium]|nr:tetratricopeptide repeat protein [Alphaproteobacteria bacterium]
MKHGTTKSSFEQLLDEAQSYAGKGDILQARSIYASLLFDYPENEQAKQGLLDLPEDGPQPSDTLVQEILDLYSDGTAAVLKQRLDHLLKEYSGSPILWNIKGGLEKQLGDLNSARQAFERVVMLKPAHPAGHSNLGVIFQEQGKLTEAVEYYNRALMFERDPFAFNNLGTILKQLDRRDEAIQSYENALNISPNFTEAHYNLGHVLADVGRLEEAAQSYRSALRSNASFRSAEVRLLLVLRQMCDWSDAEVSITVLSDTPIVETFSLLSMMDSPARHLKFSQQWAESKFKGIKAFPFEKPIQKDCLRIGYFSSDMHDHAILFLMAGLLREHNKSKFKIHIYSYGRVYKGERRKQVIKDVNSFIDISDMSDKDVVEMARGHKLDIAIDVNGYTQYSRSRLFAHRMAPIQINYLGYPSTMGADFIDYIIGDNTIISAEQRAFYSENIIYMPDCYQPNDEKRKIAKITTSRSDFGLPENSFVFCCFNNNFKITPKEYDIWMRVMRQVENSVLWLFKASDIAEKNLKCEAEARGVNPERIIFAKKVSLEEHLARHKHADLFIDTFNYNAHTTASDALWSGLPIVTKQGQQFAARVAASLLNAAGLSELVTKTEGEYESLILALAQDKARLAGVKNKLHETRSSCPLFDTVRYTRYFEAGLEKAYQDYCDGITPSDIAVSSLPLSDSANGQS